MHIFLKNKFLEKIEEAIINKITGEVLGHREIEPSITNLDNTAMCEYIEKIIQWSAETLDIVIPNAEQGKSKIDLEQYFYEYIL